MAHVKSRPPFVPAGMPERLTRFDAADWVPVEELVGAQPRVAVYHAVGDYLRARQRWFEDCPGVHLDQARRLASEDGGSWHRAWEGPPWRG